MNVRGVCGTNRGREKGPKSRGTMSPSFPRRKQMWSFTPAIGLCGQESSSFRQDVSGCSFLYTITHASLQDCVFCGSFCCSRHHQEVIRTNTRTLTLHAADSLFFQLQGSPHWHNLSCALLGELRLCTTTLIRKLSHRRNPCSWRAKEFSL